ncbi:hypothetical protein [Pseudomonas sp. DCA-1]|uniref:hypothetical protein n=1 Tax=Pseudomonas sp. DCA-1 TaxID=3344874 RepID=UPI0039778957
MKIEAIDVTLVDVPASRPIQMSFTTVQKQSYAVLSFLDSWPGEPGEAMPERSVMSDFNVETEI